MYFENPSFFILLIFIPFIFYIYHQRKTPYIRFSSGIFFKLIPFSFKVAIRRNFIFLRLLVLIFLIFGLARLRSPIKNAEINASGIDIVLALDCSGSMLAEDFTLNGVRENRLEVIKKVVKDFIHHRKSDRIGIVAFAGRAYTLSPLTLNYNWLLDNLERVKVGMIEDGTALGDGIAVSLNRLRNLPDKTRIIILLTDGRNNTGSISPLTAAELAKALRIKIYTIGVGTKGYAPYPVKDFFGNTVYRRIKIDLDETTLRKIANITGGRYFRATDTKSLRKIYSQIDRLEKSPIKEKVYLRYREWSSLFISLALIILLLEIVLKNSIFIKVP